MILNTGLGNAKYFVLKTKKYLRRAILGIKIRSVDNIHHGNFSGLRIPHDTLALACP